MARTASALSPLVQQFVDAFAAVRRDRVPITVAGVTIHPPQRDDDLRTQVQSPRVQFSVWPFGQDSIFSLCGEARVTHGIAWSHSRSGIVAAARRLAAQADERERDLTQSIAALRPIWEGADGYDRQYELRSVG